MTQRDIKREIKRIKKSFQKQPLTSVQKIARITNELNSFYSRDDILENSDLVLERLNYVSRQFNVDHNVIPELLIGLASSMIFFLGQFCSDKITYFSQHYPIIQSLSNLIGLLFFIFFAAALTLVMLFFFIRSIKDSFQSEEARILYQNELDILHRIIDKQIKKQMKKIKKAK